ncbi:MAG: fucose isomerase [Planctomycetaceae bacterium]|nr:MAG: fucose isomerase [Planctomycetaceae bacterium]
MLKGIPATISPDLMYVLMKMGHGDEIVLADGNFPADSHAQRIVRADGLSVPDVLEAILDFFPLDTFVDAPAAVMKPVNDDAPEPGIWTQFRVLMDAAEGQEVSIELVERFAFYERTRQAYAVVATSETALYANLILKKGVVTK